MLRSVLIFPQLNDRFTINRIRQRYDDLYEDIAPHISLVFPFDNELTDETIIQVVSDVIKKQQQFKLRLTVVSGDPKNGYVWLVVDQGSKILTELHDALYAEPILNPYYREDLPYQPHVTVAQGLSQLQAEQLLIELQNETYDLTATITEVAIEHILENGDSVVLATIGLGERDES